jgi:hypothetical protein
VSYTLSHCSFIKKFCSIYYNLFSVIKNCGGIVIGTVIGKWYFYKSAPRQNVKFGFQRIMFSSFGAACLGSLIIPPFNIIQGFSSFIRRFIHIQSLDKLHSIVSEFVNRYSFTYVSNFNKFKFQVFYRNFSNVYLNRCVFMENHLVVPQKKPTYHFRLLEFVSKLCVQYTNFWSKG